MELIRRFPDEVIAAALESWTFIDLAGKRAHFTSPFGDLFLEGPDGFWIVDVVGGSLDRICATAQELNAILNSHEGRNQYLMVGLAADADADGLTPNASQVYDFRVPPVLGGKLEPSNLQVMDFEVAVNIAGQIHAQVRDLPPGTAIGGAEIK